MKNLYLDDTNINNPDNPVPLSDSSKGGKRKI
jgi:hypothetical protein